MSKTIVCLLSIISIVLAKEYWQCDSYGKNVCPKTQTCCRSRIDKSGWSCFPSVEAVCCSDGLSACPKGTICNLREKKCDTTALTFLAEQNATPIDSAAQLSKGFFEGLEIFSNLPHQDDCKLDDQLLIQDIVDVIDLIKNLSLKSELLKTLKEIVVKVEDAYTRIGNLSGTCTEWANEIQNVMNKVLAHVKSKTYLAELPVHIAFNISNIKSKSNDGNSKYAAGDFFGAGRAYGDLLHFALLWNFKN